MAISIANPLTDPDWDAKVASFPEATPFHTAAWARVLHETYGFDPCYFVVSDSSCIQAIQPMMEVKTWATHRRGISLPFTDECGLLTSPSVDHSSLVPSILAHAKRRRWRSVEFRAVKVAANDEAADVAYVRHVLDLRQEPAELVRNFDPSNRRAIRKAEKDGVTVSFESSESAMRVYFSLHEMTRQRHGVPPQPWAFFASIQRHLLAVGRGVIALARLGEQVIGGAVFFAFGRSTVYKFGASDERFQNHRPNNLIMDRAIKHLRERGAEELHFGRSDVAHAGLRAFKRSWGCCESPLVYSRLDPLTGHRMSAQHSAGWRTCLRPLMRLSPAVASRWAGALLYKHTA